MKKIKGGINKPMGFVANGIYAKVKARKRDLALIYSHTPCVVAGVFTKNTIKAEPVIWDQKIVNKKGRAKALLVISGMANSCTGEKGVINHYRIVKKVSQTLEIEDEEVLVCCTGLIGKQLPIEPIQIGIERLSSHLNKYRSGGSNAAKAMMTTDTYEKEIAVQVEIEGYKVTIAGMAKGSGMVCPDMATVLGIITTDANISKELLQRILTEGCDLSFNQLCVDGESSTNDTVLALANGCAGNLPILEDSKNYHDFKEAFHYVCKKLAKDIIKDGEGSNKSIELVIKGAHNKQDAKKMVRTVLGSLKVKTLIHGCDSDWGRLINAMSYSGVSFTTDQLSIVFKSDCGELEIVKDGIETDYDDSQLFCILNEHHIYIIIDLKTGKEEAVGWGCDLTCQYVKMNSKCL